MIAGDPSRAAHDALRVQLAEAARREFAASRATSAPRRRHRRRWVLGLVLGASFGVAAAVGAGDFRTLAPSRRP